VIVKLREKFTVAGLEYLEEGMNEAGTAPSFYCKLCNCHFTDVMAKVMHTKGRRHRLQYKKKVDPTLKVEMKLSPFDRRNQLRRNKSVSEVWRKRELQATYK
jgi:zinc finger RNA-binding protein